MLRWPHVSRVFVLTFIVTFGLAVTSVGSPLFPSSSSPSQSSPQFVPDSTHVGVVWTPPSHPDSALQDLQQIHAAGATALRVTHLPSDDTIFERADTLGLRLFVDLSVGASPGPALRDSLTRTADVLDRVLALARQHSSLQYIGLAYHADTTDPRACSILEEWSNRVHAQTDPSIQTYYVTPFSAAVDRCADAVDLPLLDVRGHPDPVARWSQWRRATEQVGIGGLGTWVRPGAGPGLRVPHSPERQARHLEQAFSQLLDSTRTLPPALFVYRWRDQTSSPLPSRRYGLHERDGTPRPAAAVVRGYYTGNQRVFAFPSGSEPPATPQGLLLLGWGLIALLGGLYARNPAMRHTVTRYFTAHGFYRDALRNGRIARLGTNVALLGVVAAALGTTVAIAAQEIASKPAAEFILEALPSGGQTPLARTLEYPTVVGMVFGGAAFVLLFVWTFLLVLIARRWMQFTLGQGLMMVSWPCWPALPIMLIALVGSTHPSISPLLLVGLLLGTGGLAAVFSTIRILIDYRAITSVPLLIVNLLAALSPVALALGALIIAGGRYDDILPLLWRLATLT